MRTPERNQPGLDQLGTFTVQQTGRVLVATFANPPHDFLDAAGVRDLDALVRLADRDASVGAVVLTGRTTDAGQGRFITHFDAAELAGAAEFPAPHVPPLLGELAIRAGVLATWPDLGKAVAERLGPLGTSLATLSRLHRIIRRMHRSRVVWVAAVGGPCMGAGLEMALACDLRVAADSTETVFGQPEILAGIIPGAGGTQHLPRVVGTARALELILEGNSMSAKEALELGLVSSVVPAASLVASASELAARLASRPPEAVAAAKRAVYVGSARGIGNGLAVEGGALISAGKARIARRLAKAFDADLRRLGDSPFVVEPEPWVSGKRAE